MARDNDPDLLKLLSLWHRPWGHRLWITVLLILLLVLTSTLLVYATGGIKYVYSHSMYLPILLAGGIFGPLGGALAGLAGGLALGPFMPIETATGEMQEPINWLYRTGFFMLIGGFTGMLVDSVVRMTGHDPISGALNQMPLRRTLNEMTERYSQGRQAPFSLFIVVFDNHGEVVNTFGPEIGQRLMRHVVARLEAALRGTSAVYHLHGEWFAFIAPRDELEALQKRVQEQFRGAITANGIPVYINLTLGRADCPEHGEDMLSLVQRATIAASQASHEGRPEAIYDLRFDYTNRENLLLLGDLGQAIVDDQLRLHHQPQYHVGEGRVTRVEALVRWEHPGHGLLPPGKFLPQAEKTHLIHELTPWILRAALHDLHAFRKQGHDWCMAVNLSARNLHDALLLPTIESGLKDSGFEPEHLELEVTESAIMFNPAHALKVLEDLRSMGVGIAIDDFGTGQTTLNYLKDLPASSLKIDRSFTRQLLSDPRVARIVESMIQLGHNLEMAIVAEGVEDTATLEWLEHHQCDIIQGFLISHPQPAPDFADFRYPAAV